MNSKRLQTRKNELAGLQEVNLKEIRQEIKRRDTQDAQDYIKSGEVGQIDGHRLGELQQKKQHLERLASYLILAITKERTRERQSKLKKFDREIAILDEQRKGRMYQQYKKLIEKIEELKKKSIALKAQILEIENLQRQIQKDTVSVIFRLPELEKTLAENYFAKPYEIQAMVERAYEANAKCLKKELMIRGEDRLVRGFQLTLDVDSGQLLQKKETICDRETARNHPNVMCEVKR